MEEFCEKQSDPNEPASHWNARKQFIVNNWDHYHGNQLVSLAMVWSNMEFDGSTYPPELMKRVLEMARGITVDDKPNITVSRSQQFDKPKPKPTPEVISMTDFSETVVCRPEEEGEWVSFEKEAKGQSVKEMANTGFYTTLGQVKRRLEEEEDENDPAEFQKTEKRPRLKEMPYRGWYTALELGGSAEFEQSKCNEIACQPGTTCMYDAVISTLAENLREQHNNKRGSGPALKRLHAAAKKVPLKTHVEQIEIPPVTMPGNSGQSHGNIKSKWLCNMYYDDILLASVKAENKHASRRGAAQKAVSILESLNYAVKNEKKVSELGRKYSKEVVLLEEPTTALMYGQNGILDNFTFMELPNQAPAVSNSAFTKKHVPIVFEAGNNLKTVDGETGYMCSTIINGVSVATGFHIDKREARNVSANNALALLRDQNSSIKKNFDHIQNVVFEPVVKVPDLVIKLENNDSDSVIETDKVPESVSVNSPKKVFDKELMQTTSPISVQKQGLDNFTLMEPATPAPAVSILVNSAFQNHVPIEFKTSNSVKMVNGKNGFVCSTIINGITVASGCHRFKEQARDVSANNALALLRDQSANMKENPDNTQNVVIEPDIKMPDFDIKLEPDMASDSVPVNSTKKINIKMPDFDIKLEPDMASDSVPVNSTKKINIKVPDFDIKLEPDIKVSDSVPVNLPKKLHKQLKQKTTPINVQNSILDNFTLMEPSSPASAVSILVNSAFKNHVPIEFETRDNVRTLDGKTGHVCSTIIYSITDATGFHADNRHGRNVSANNALALLRDHSSDMKEYPDNTQNVVTEPDIKVPDFDIKLEPDIKVSDFDIKLEPDMASDSVPVNSTKKINIKVPDFDIKLEPDIKVSDSVIKPNKACKSVQVNLPEKTDEQLKQKTSPINVQNGILANFTLMKLAGPAPAVSILVNSAFKNHVPIKFETSDNVRTVNGETGYVCSTIINDVTVATGFHTDKRQARDVSANNALALLRDQSTNMNKNPDNTQNVVTEPNSKVSGSVIKPNLVSKSVQVNLPKKTDEQNRLANFTLMELAGPAPAVSILVNSAFKNHVPIEFETSDNVRTVDGETGYVCSTIINGVTVATGIHTDKRQARDVSANNALALLRDQNSNMKKMSNNTRNVVTGPNKKPSDSVQVKPPKKGKYAPIGESNVGYKLLRLMGWEGGALHKDGIVDPIEASEKFCRGGFGFVDAAPKFSKSKQKKINRLIKKIKKNERKMLKRNENSKVATGGEDEVNQEDRENLQFDEEICDVKRPEHFEFEKLVLVIETFANQREKEDLIFSAAFNRRERRLIHSTCHRFKLEDISHGKERRMVVRHKLQI